MSLFQRAGMQSWVTKKSNDFGIDGFAFGNTTGWVAVQCKRNSLDNKVGGPVVLHFSGALRHQGDLVVEGYILTTSTFTKDAIEAASKVSIHLMDIDDIVAWKNSMPEILLTREDYTS
jgi:restriction endonuclease Mrr